jgi:hypothetical protein
MMVGAAVSTDQMWLAAEPSVLPASSVALTKKVWEPSLRPVRFLGEVQFAKAELAGSSRLHSKVRFAEGVTSSVPENVKLGEALFDGFAGSVSMVVSGASVSTVPVFTVQVRLAGEVSVSPEAIALTRKVWLP